LFDPAGSCDQPLRSPVDNGNRVDQDDRTTGTKAAQQIMNFWQHVETSAGMGRHYPWVLLGCIVIAMLLVLIAPHARQRLRAAVLLIGLSFAAMLVCGLLTHSGTLGPTTAGFRYIHFGSQLLFSLAVINILGVLVFRLVLAPVRLEPAPILRDTLLGLSYIVVALALLSRHGVDLSGIVATSAVVTAVIGFSLQDTLGNIMGGVALQMEQSIAVGDWIRVGDIEGIVREIRWRQTSIETRNWDTVVIPNSVLMKAQVTVLGRRAGQPKLHRVWVEFNVDFRHPPADVIDAVERALGSEAIPNVAADPPPNCILREFKESYGHYAVRYWLSDLAKDDPTSSEVRTRIFVALQRAGINLSIPAQSVFLTMESRSRAQRKQQDELNRRVAALKQVMILKPLTEAEQLEIAEQLSVAPFRQGEPITRQGNEAHYLYIVIKGSAEVRVAGETNESRAIATLSSGDVFGEMGLLTGEPRTATVTALTDAVCYRLDKDAFRDVLHGRPEIAEAISHLLAKRKLELEALTQGLDANAMQHRVGNAQNDLLQRIRKFFTLG
jgi:small-conductance mechanosensitive channel/CRP-like cAMP-binding protein